MKKHHTIEVTTGNSHLCKEGIDNNDTGKCKGYKIVGIPDFPWICGNDLYRKLELQHPLNRES